MSAPLITAAVIALNEEAHIVPCLESMAWADELLVMDGGSSDRTAPLASQFGARVEQRPFDTFPAQRNAALRLAANDWVLFVDADERVTPELALATRETVGAAAHCGYYIPRYNYIFGRVIRHTGWYPDYQMRLLDRRSASYDEEVPVHEVVRLESGSPGYLVAHFVHYNYRTIGQFIRKQERYTDFEASQLRQQGSVHARSLVSMPLREFFRRYVQLAGYRDGAHGLLLSGLMAYFMFRRYWKCLN